MTDRNTSRNAGVVMIVGGLALAALTFMTWFEINGNDVNAWDALRRSDVALFGAGIVAAACGAWLGFGDPGPEGRFVAMLAAAAGFLAALVIVVRIVSPPGDGDVKLGIFLALLGALIAAVGGLMALTSGRGPAPAGSGPTSG